MEKRSQIDILKGAIEARVREGDVDRTKFLLEEIQGPLRGNYEDSISRIISFFKKDDVVSCLDLSLLKRLIADYVHFRKEYRLYHPDSRRYRGLINKAEWNYRNR